MIRKLRLKFVAICMSMVTAVLAVVFLMIFFSVQRSVVNLSRQVLYRVAQDQVYSVTMEDGGGMVRPDISVTIGGDRVLLPYFTVELWGSRAYVTGGTYANLEDTEALQSILTDCLRQEPGEGLLRQYRLRYLRQDNGLYQKLAFVDVSMESSMLGRLIRS